MKRLALILVLAAAACDSPSDPAPPFSGEWRLETVGSRALPFSATATIQPGSIACRITYNGTLTFGRDGVYRDSVVHVQAFDGVVIAVDQSFHDEFTITRQRGDTIEVGDPDWRMFFVRTGETTMRQLPPTRWGFGADTPATWIRHQ